MTPRSAGRDALRVAITYAVLAIVWIVGTDLLLRTWVADLQQGMWLETLKGTGFAVVTGAFLYWWVRRHMSKREEEHRNLRTLTEQVPDMIFRLRLRPEVVFDYVSPGAVNLAGFTPREIYEDLDRVIDAVHPDDRGRLQKLLSDPDSIEDSLELRWTHKDGHTVWVEFRVTRHLDSDGHVHTVEGIARDISERRAEEEQKSLLATAVDAVGEAVYVTDTHGRIEYVNPAFSEITGYSQEEALGKTPRILKSGRQGEDFYEELWGTITSGRTFRGELVNRRKDGTLYDHDATITPVQEHEKGISHYVAVARDVTMRNEMERQLHRSYKMDMVGQMAAGISHDFRNLLNVIQVNAELLGDVSGPRVDPAELSRQAAEIETAARRGADLVSDLLTLAREKELNLEVVDPARLLTGTERALRAVLPESVSIETATAEGMSIRADPGTFHQILLNLATNAGHAMPDGGSFSIEVVGVQRRPADGATDSVGAAPDMDAEVSNYVCVALGDTGVGIDREFLSRIFDPFYTTKDEGTGLGLAMVRSLVHQHGGFIQVDSEVGVGTTFELFFPRHESVAMVDEGDHEGDELEGSALPGGHERILLVEDEAPLREVAEKALIRLGYTVELASNGREALQKIDADDPGWELVLTDLVMPEMGGVDLHTTIENRGIQVRFLFMSGYGAEEDGLSANPDRFRFFLQKPWTIEDLAWKVREALDAGPHRP